MNATEITNKIRLLILEEQARFLAAEDFTEVQTDAINILANLLVAAAPEFFEKKVSLAPKATNTHVFQFPSDYLNIKAVWDYDGDALDITATADNGSGLIRLTFSAAHGLSDEDVITVHDTGGTTEANGTWQIDYDSATHGTTKVDLVGSAYANAWTAGGRAFVEKEDTYKYPLTRKPSKFQSAGNENYYFTNEDDIWVDDPDFENDLIVLYRYLPSTLAEIPSRMHFGIPGFGAKVLMRLPPRVNSEGEEHPLYNALRKNLKIAEELWGAAVDMAKGFKPILENHNISDQSVKRWL